MRYGLRAANKNDIANANRHPTQGLRGIHSKSLNVMERPGPRSQDLMLIQA